MVRYPFPGLHYIEGQGEKLGGLTSRVKVQVVGGTTTIGRGSTGLRVVLSLSSRHTSFLLRPSTTS